MDWFCRYIDDDEIAWKVQIEPKFLRIWQMEGYSRRVDRMNSVSRIFILGTWIVEMTAFGAWSFSKSQLLHSIPGQRRWNRKITFFVALGRSPCKQAFPQKQNSAIALLEKTANIRNKTTNLNVLWFPIRSLPSGRLLFFLSQTKAYLNRGWYFNQIFANSFKSNNTGYSSIGDVSSDVSFQNSHKIIDRSEYSLKMFFWQIHNLLSILNYSTLKMIIRTFLDCWYPAHDIRNRFVGKKDMIDVENISFLKLEILFGANKGIISPCPPWFKLSENQITYCLRHEPATRSSCSSFRGGLRSRCSLKRPRRRRYRLHW